MTVTYKGEFKRKGKNDKGLRSYTRSFRLVTDSRSDGVFAVGSHASLPLIGSTFPQDPAAYCTSLTVENTEEWTGWTVTAEYTTDPLAVLDSYQGNPVDADPVITWSSEIYQEPVFKDTSGNAILNGAGDYFIDPAPQRDASHLIAQIAKNVSSVPSWALAYTNSINSSAITIDGLAVAEKLAKVQRIGIGKWQVSGQYTYREITIEIHIHRNGWNLEPLHAGFNHKVGGVIKPILVKDLDSSGTSKDDTPITQPAPITAAGALITDPTPANAEFGDFTIYDELDFTQLPGVS